jgi:DNA-directed RNA polymerase sigma subunit (sigma70/sigma32)
MISTDRFEVYRDAVRSMSKLSPGESSKLAWSAWLGDSKARRELIEKHLWLALESAEGGCNGDFPGLVRLVEEGNRSLARAAEVFRPWVDGDFTAFAQGRLPGADRRAPWMAGSQLPEVEIAFMGWAAS